MPGSPASASSFLIRVPFSSAAASEASSRWLLYTTMLIKLRAFFYQNSRDLGWGSSSASELSTVEAWRPEPGCLMHISAITTLLKPDRRCRRKNLWNRTCQKNKRPCPKQGGRWGPTLKACTHSLWLLLSHVKICTHMNMHSWIHHT